MARRTSQVPTMTELLQNHIPYPHELHAPLPGIGPISLEDWLWIDDAYAAQMKRRRELLASDAEKVCKTDPSGFDAAQELMWHAIEWAEEHKGFKRTTAGVLCPDGVEIAINDRDPMATLGQIFQNDFCILEKRGDEHVMTAVVLCFPASWMLSEKFMRPLIGIHDTVDVYDDTLARRVQRLFDGSRVGHPMWRYNILRYVDPELFQPRSIHDRRPDVDRSQGHFLRSERQTLYRLPTTQAVVFGIHTFVVHSPLK